MRQVEDLFDPNNCEDVKITKKSGNKDFFPFPVLSAYPRKTKNGPGVFFGFNGRAIESFKGKPMFKFINTPWGLCVDLRAEMQNENSKMINKRGMFGHEDLVKTLKMEYGVNLLIKTHFKLEPVKKSKGTIYKVEIMEE